MRVGSSLSGAVQVACGAAYAAGAVVRSAIAPQHPRLQQERARIRLRAEAAAIASIERAFPHHAIYAKGGDDPIAAAVYKWRFDALDGEGNLSLQIPHCAVCLTLLEDALPLLSVIYQPFLNATYTATYDHGAYCNGARIRVAAPATSLQDDTVSLLFDQWTGDDYLALRFLTNLRAHTRRALTNWAVSLDWCHLACGATGGLVSLSHEKLVENPAMLAGAFFFQQAGGYMGDLTGSLIQDFVHKSVIAAATPARLEEIRRVVDRPLRATSG
jgi:fructose-1,6-bisphosphatase/inositol monophosphatase family enzyme